MEWEVLKIALGLVATVAAVWVVTAWNRNGRGGDRRDERDRVEPYIGGRAGRHNVEGL